MGWGGAGKDVSSAPSLAWEAIHTSSRAADLGYTPASHRPKF